MRLSFVLPLSLSLSVSLYFSLFIFFDFLGISFLLFFFLLFFFSRLKQRPLKYKHNPNSKNKRHSQQQRIWQKNESTRRIRKKRTTNILFSRKRKARKFFKKSACIYTYTYIYNIYIYLHICINTCQEGDKGKWNVWNEWSIDPFTKDIVFLDRCLSLLRHFNVRRVAKVGGAGSEDG